MISTTMCLYLLFSSSEKWLPVISWWDTGATAWRGGMALHCYQLRWREHWVTTPLRSNMALSYWEGILNRIYSSGPLMPTPSRVMGLRTERKATSGYIWRSLRDRWCIAHNYSQQRWQGHWVPTPQRRNFTLSSWEGQSNSLTSSGPWRPTPSSGMGSTGARRTTYGPILRILREQRCYTRKLQWRRW